MSSDAEPIYTSPAEKLRLAANALHDGTADLEEVEDTLRAGATAYESLMLRFERQRELFDQSGRREQAYRDLLVRINETTTNALRPRG